VTFAGDPTLAGLVAAMRAANRAVTDGGTTLTAVAVTVDDGMVFAQLGDSRLYGWRRGRLTQMTDDHTLVEPAAVVLEREAVSYPVGQDRVDDSQLAAGFGELTGIEQNSAGVLGCALG
jgi:serine/threonine protein phosphatase PrpC